MDEEQATVVVQALQTVSARLLEISHDVKREAQRVRSTGQAPRVDRAMHSLTHQITVLRLAQNLGRDEG